ncbi:MAG: hypothetical protein AVDCRST_MAG49-2676, partial [uncultured Thermomicrobiales bacterium]
WPRLTRTSRRWRLSSPSPASSCGYRRRRHSLVARQSRLAGWGTACRAPAVPRAARTSPRPGDVPPRPRC